MLNFLSYLVLTFRIQCVCVCVCVVLCADTRGRVHIWMSKHSFRHHSSPSTLFETGYAGCFHSAVYVRLADPRASGGSPVFISHFPIAVLRLQTLMPCIWILHRFWAFELGSSHLCSQHFTSH